MNSLLTNSGFHQLLSTFLSWAIAYLLIWIISRFFLVKKNSLERASEMLRRTGSIFDSLSAKCTDNSLPLVDDAVSSMRQVKKMLCKSDKMLSIYQYDHSDIMDLITMRSSLAGCMKLCETFASAVQDNKNKAAISALAKMQKICKDAVSSIDEISKAQSRKKMLEV
ncbi:MAG: hypothetical protein PHO44_08360 [Sphaerochaetaceae bacterium]|jgi:hypothetical protein|nr:hypothetical protein [Sphaerochaetaceae bacterium]MDD3164093.1 hypothetical protein [Sphaerochaetaceae bacterium]MDD4007978.1 hypothetical protein [Sphaerochaetaceae bacterium]MDD4397860.1 hypothetical protein [Sphaerochaetaceae bacterium]